MKKFSFLAILVFTLLLSACSCSCKDKKKPVKEYYTITFVSNGGTIVSDAQYEKGETIVEPEVPSKPDFNFIEWCSDEELTIRYEFISMPAENITLYAKWEASKNVRVTFNVEGVKTNQVYAIGETITYDEPEKEGYDFDGWYLSDGSKFNMVAPNLNTEVEAKFNLKNTYREVNYYINGKLELTEAVAVNSNLELPTNLFSENTSSEGWFTTEDLTTKVSDSTVVTENMDVYANNYTNGLEISSGEVIKYLGDSNDVIIPNYYNGEKVTVIKEFAFYNKTNVYNVIMPEGLETIENNAFYKATYLVEALIPSTVNVIGEFAFFQCERLERVGSLAKIETVEASTFAGCTELYDVDIPSTVTVIEENAFSGCKNITKITFPSELVTIEEFAFFECVKLEEVFIPRTTRLIGDDAFYKCSSIKSITVESGNPDYRSYDGNLMNYQRTILILYVQGEKNDTDYKVTSQTLKEHAFYGNKNLISLDISAVRYVEQGALQGMVNLEKLTVNEIGYSLEEKNFIGFYFGLDDPLNNGSANAYVSDLKEINIVSEVLEIADYAFYGINSLEKINGIDKVTKIGNYSFAYTGLTEFKISNDLESFEYNAFSNCDNLTKYVVDGTNEKYQVVDGILYSKDMKNLVLVPSGLKEITISSEAKTICTNAFYTSNITELVIPNTITSIEKGALSGVKKLNHLSIPFIGDGANENYIHHLFGATKTVSGTGDNRSVSFDDVNLVPSTLRYIEVTELILEIPEYAFYACDEVTEVVYPNSVTKIGDFAFAINSLQEITIGENIESIGDYGFAYSFSVAKIVVPGTVKSLGEFAFGFSQSVTEVIVEEGIETLPYGFMVPYYETDSTNSITYYSNLTSITLPASLVTIGEFSFTYAGTSGTTCSVVDLVITDFDNSNLKTIESGAFEGSGIKELYLPASVEVIMDFTFDNSPNLEKVVIGTETNGSNLKELYAISFYHDPSLVSFTLYKNITSSADVPTIVSYYHQSSDTTFYNPFEASSNVKIYVLETAVETLKTVWSDLSEIIEAIK